MVECEHIAGVKQETAPTAVKSEIKEEESSAFSAPRGASAAGNEEASGEPHVEHQQSENREAPALASVREEKNDNEELKNPFAAGDDNEEAAGGDDLVQPTNDGNGDDGYANPVMPATSIPTSKVARSEKRPHEAASSIEKILETGGRKQEARNEPNVHILHYMKP